MPQIVIDIPRVGSNYTAEEVYRAFTSLGWTHSMTGYLPQGAGRQPKAKVRTLSFQWTKSERPIYPRNISYRAIA